MKQLAYGSDALQYGQLFVPEGAGPHPVALLIHGGFWLAAYGLDLMTGLAQDLVALGIAVWNIEYRRVGDRGGGWTGTLLDVARAADYLLTIAPVYHLDVQRVVSIGHSAGGHLALWLAASRRLPQGSPLVGQGTRLSLRGVISLAGVVDLEMGWRLNLGGGAVTLLLGGSPGTFPQRYAAASPVELLPVSIPLVLIHGTEDRNVPISVSQSYLQKAKAMGDTVRLIELPGVGHMPLIDPTSEAWQVTRAELQKLLQG